ncbi:MAG: hypothetical protein JXR97_10765, partial [Planctomycetes bacterium]|nr:hypothetical protein [Planctomycetota bacterium]
IILKGEGDAEAVKYYQIFNRQPELANYVRKLDAFKSIIKENSTIVLPSNEVPMDILKEQPPKVKPEAGVAGK